MDVKEIKDIVDEGCKGLEGKMDERFKSQFESQKAEIVKEIEGKGFKSGEDIDKIISEKIKDLESTVLDLKKSGLGKSEGKPKSLKQLFGASMEETKQGLIDLKNNKTKSANLILTKADEDLDPANFANDSYEIATSERRGLYESPFAPFWFRNLMPQGSISGGVLQYLKENGNVGAAGVWDGTGAIAELESKPGTAPLFDSVTESVMWIAGITRVKREMLDDIAWLRGYLSRRLTVGRTGLWVAENTQIFNALTTNSTAYDGTKTIPIEIIYDAAFGQLRDNYHNPTTILMNSRDVVNLIALNKATGSGEYDLPPGTVVTINGQLTIGGVPVIGAPNVPANEFIVMDRNATEFISRISPEVRFFEEDRDNVPKNLVTVRAEERILPVVYDDTAVIYGELTTT